MKFCDAHWAQLRKSIDDRGMGHLVSPDSETLGERLMDQVQDEQLRGAVNAANYDPLMNATMMIYGRAVEVGGLYLMTTPPGGGEYCPLCEANQHITEPHPSGKDPATVWIDGCTDSILDYLREHGQMPAVQ